MTVKSKNKFLRVQVSREDARMANIMPEYEAEKVARIAAPGAAQIPSALWEFQNEFTLAEETELVVFISADQRFELYADGVLEAEGPDRSDLAHWSFAAYHVKLSAGHHEFRVLHWHLAHGCAPNAQITLYPFFLLSCREEPFRALLDTGKAPWRVRRIRGITFDEQAPSFLTRRPVINVREWATPAKWQVPETVFVPLERNMYGCLRSGHRLYPTPLPEQSSITYMQGLGHIRAVADGTGLDHKFGPADIARPEVARWQALLDSGKPVEIPPGVEFAVLIDLKDYYCGYPMLEASGGGTECISVFWQEALFNLDTGLKEDRSRIEGFAFPKRCDGDSFRCFPEKKQLCRSLWWRSGRYLLLSVKTVEKTVTVFSLGIRETRYPLEDEGCVETSHDRLRATLPAIRKAMQMCAHETFMDCPYYEQLMYVGDTRLECLVFYVMHREFALPLRAVELFDWSRHNWEGIVAEHYPSCTPQLSSTFAMIWCWMVRDLALYRRPDDAFLRRVRLGVRNLINCLLEYRNADGLLEKLPGWSFVDWVTEWGMRVGVPPGDSQGSSAIFQLHMVGALQAAAELETLPGGDDLLCSKFRREAKRLADATLRVYWDEVRGMPADDQGHTEFSEHALILALLFDVLDPEQANRCYCALLNEGSLRRTTIYFSFYLFEVMRKRGDAHLIPEKMHWWYEATRLNAVTTWESPVPRSDCHAWGSHPLYHIHCSLAGIRPSSFGLRTVEIRPQLGGMAYLQGCFPHPDGEIRYDYRNGGTEFHAEFDLPGELTGEFFFQGVRHTLKPGKNIFQLHKES